jgi:hypothetical protein
MSLVALIRIINIYLDKREGKTLTPMQQAFAKAVNR